MPAEIVLGAILAGGQSRRMGGIEKATQLLAGRTLLDHVIARARPQVAELVLNANGDPARFDGYGLTVLPDVVKGFAGPLAGILTVLEWARENFAAASWIATFPADAPFIPSDYVARMLAAADDQGARLACAASGGRTHPVCGLWSADLAPDLRLALVGEDIRKIDIWTARYRLAQVEFDDAEIDPFFNINRPEDLEKASGWAEAS